MGVGAISDDLLNPSRMMWTGGVGHRIQLEGREHKSGA